MFMPHQIDGFENLWIKIKINCKVSFTIGIIYRTKNNVLNCAQSLNDFFLKFCRPLIILLFWEI